MNKAESWRVESDSTRIEFSRLSSGSLVSLLDKRTGHEFLEIANRPAPLWEATLTTPEGKKVVSSRDAGELRITEEKCKKYGKRFVMIWSEFKKPLDGVKVVISAELDHPNSLIKLRMLEFNPGQGNGVWHVDFPMIGGLTEIGKEGKNDQLAIPLFQGILIRGPLSTIAANENVKRVSYSYPGPLTMQWFSYCNETIASLYIASYDSLGYRKDFVFEVDEAGKGKFWIRNYPENRGFVGRVYSISYPIVISSFQGGWVEASNIYRRWATQQAWCRRGKLSQRTDIPKWLSETSLWVWNRGKAAKVAPGSIDLRKRTGVNVALLWYWWHHNPYDVFNPEYLPPREGVETFMKAVQQLKSEGIKVIVYINGRIWDMRSGSWLEQQAQKAAALDENLKPYEERYNVFMPDHVHAPMCPTTQLWRDKISFLVRTLINDFLVDGVYIDQVAAAPASLCHSSEHGHPVGGGYYWTYGYHDLIQRARDIAKMINPDACLLSESCIEQFIDLFDGFLTLDSSWERAGIMKHMGQNWEPIPMFNAVYHDYAITFGSYASMTGVPPYDDLWPEATRPPEYNKFVTFNDKYPDQFAFELARTLIWGIQPMVANIYPEMIGRNEFEEDMKFLVDVVRFHAKAKDYLIFGKWLPPPKVECPHIFVKMYVRSIYTKPEMATEFTRDTPSVLSSAWGTEDGRCCVLLVNFTRSSVSAVVRINLAEYGFQTKEKVVMRDYPDGVKETILDSLEFERRVNLPSRSIIAYEFLAK